MKKKIIWNNKHSLKKKLQSCRDFLVSKKEMILTIEPYSSTFSLFKKAKELGYGLVALSADKGQCILTPEFFELVDYVVVVDTHNLTELLILTDVLRDIFTIKAVIPGFEYVVPEAAYLAAHLNLPGLPLESIKYARSKEMMRKCLLKNGLATPQFALVYSKNDVSKLHCHLSFPLVCKPFDAAGSVLVKKVINTEEMFGATRDILEHDYNLWGHTLKKGVIVEEFIEGKEFSVEGIIQYGQASIFSVTEKFLANQYDFVEIGHLINPPIAANIAYRIKKYCAEVLAILGLDHTPFHLELRLNAQQQPVLIEVAARLAGDRIGDLIDLCSNVNYLEQVLSVYLGNDVLPSKPGQAYAGIRFFYRPKIDSYKDVRILNQQADITNKIIDLQYYYKENTPIPSFPKALKRLGHVIMMDDHYANLKKSLDVFDQAVQFVA